MNARSLLLSMCDMSGSKVSNGRRKIGIIGFLVDFCVVHEVREWRVFCEVFTQTGPMCTEPCDSPDVM